MVITIGGVKTPPSSRASAALVHTDAAGGPRAQRANSQTPLFSAVLFWSKNPGDDAPGAWDFPPKTVLAFLNCLCYNDDS